MHRIYRNSLEFTNSCLPVKVTLCVAPFVADDNLIFCLFINLFDKLYDTEAAPGLSWQANPPVTMTWRLLGWRSEASPQAEIFLEIKLL